MIKNILHKFSTNKNLALLALFTVALALTACGGSSSSNPLGPYTPPTPDSELEEKHPSVYNAYASMTAALEDGAATPASRTAIFMEHIADDFVPMTGNGDKSHLETVTKSRLERYTIHNYTFTPVSHKLKASDTLEVVTNLAILVSPKQDSGTTIRPAPIVSDLIWKLQTDDSWKIYTGLPYRSEDTVDKK